MPTAYGGIQAANVSEALDVDDEKGLWSPHSLWLYERSAKLMKLPCLFVSKQTMYLP